MSHHRKVASAIFLFACGSIAIYPKSVPLSPEDMRAAERRYYGYSSEAFSGSSGDLHSLPPGPDGARGYTYEYKCFCTWDPRPMQEVQELQLQTSFCNDSAIVIARELSTQSILSTKKGMIFTLYQFQVIGSLKSSTDVKIGRQISVMRFGGELMDDNELLRVKYANTIPFITGKTYIVELLRAPETPSSYFFGADFPTILIEDGRISPAGDTWGPFGPGERLGKVRSGFNRIGRKGRCNK